MVHTSLIISGTLLNVGQNHEPLEIRQSPIYISHLRQIFCDFFELSGVFFLLPGEVYFLLLWWLYTLPIPVGIIEGPGIGFNEAVAHVRMRLGFT